MLYVDLPHCAGISAGEILGNGCDGRLDCYDCGLAGAGNILRRPGCIRRVEEIWVSDALIIYRYPTGHIIAAGRKLLDILINYAKMNVISKIS